MKTNKNNKRLKSLFVSNSPASTSGKKDSTGKKVRNTKKAPVQKPEAKSKKSATKDALKDSYSLKKTTLKSPQPVKITNVTEETRQPELVVGKKEKAASRRKSALTKPVVAKPSIDEKSSVQRIIIEKSLVKGLDNLKEKVEAAKFFTPMRAVKEEPEVHDLPHKYGICRIICLVRDPYWLHTYWEVTEDRLREAERYFGEEWNRTKTILRVHDITGVDFNGDNSKAHFDIELSGGAESWYINANSPNTSFVVDIARIGPSGRTFILARSNNVTTPRDGMSDILDEQWMSLDFDKMYALSGGFKMGSTSMEMQEMMKQRLMSDVSSWGGSGAVSSFGGSPVAVKRRGFWFMLDCELIVYGATEPDAKVTMQGHPINLRPDGTFTVRFALPDGMQKIETTATSSDGVEERTITPTVSRTTASQNKILKEF